MELINLKKFSNNGCIYITKLENKNIIYSYNENNIAFIEVDYFGTDEPIEIKNTKGVETVLDLVELLKDNSKYNLDAEPFDFNVDIKVTDTDFNLNNLSNLVNSFKGYYKDDSLNPEYTGIHFRKSNVFATNGSVLKLFKSTILGDDVNLVLDLLPIVNSLDLDTRKIKNVGKSLFQSKSKINNIIGYAYKNDEPIFYLKTESLSYYSICKCYSTLNFSKMTTFNKDVICKLHKEKIKSILQKYENVDLFDIDTRKDTILLDFTENNLSIYVYDYQGNHLLLDKMPVKCNKSFDITVDISLLSMIINDIQNNELSLYIDEFSKIINFKENETNKVLTLIGTLLKK